jgi:hypothetical protein
MRLTLLAAVLSALAASATAHSADPKPKYGPKDKPRAQPLSAENAFLREAGNPAPDFWKLIPYYAAQATGGSCLVASVAMVVNAARAATGSPLTSEDKLVTQQELLEKVKAEDWKRRTTSKLGRGVTLEQLGKVTHASLRAYGFASPVVTATHVDSDEAKKRFVEALERSEKAATDFLLVNFVQSAATDDSDTGHIAPVGAYDARAKRVLVLDPDREWYEPYWVSVDDLLKGMATLDKESGKSRGFVRVIPGSAGPAKAAPARSSQ